MLTRARYVLFVLLACIPLVTAGPSPPQDDGASGGDAANVCSADLVTIDIDGGALGGRLDPPQDSRDYYGLLVDADDVNRTFEVRVQARSSISLEVFTPECGRNVVAESPACARADRCVGHSHIEGPGHERCFAPGHQDDEGCDTEQGERSDFGEAVVFTPSQEGVYVALVSIEPNASGNTKTGDYEPSSCHLSCMDYSLTSSELETTAVS